MGGVSSPSIDFSHFNFSLRVSSNSIKSSLDFKRENLFLDEIFFHIFRPSKTDITGKDRSLHNFHGVCYYVIFTSELEGFWDYSD